MIDTQEPSVALDASHPPQSDRRRPGRIVNVSPALIPLLRDVAVPTPDYAERQQNDLARGVIPLERALPIERPHDVPLGRPSPEALQLATEAIRRCYVLPETIQHSQVLSECMCLAYLIQAYGLALAEFPPQHRRMSGMV